MHPLTTWQSAIAAHSGVPRGNRAGYSLLEALVALAILSVLAPAVAGSAMELRARGQLTQARETAARLIALGRWTAVRDGGASVEFAASPPRARVVSAMGDTVASADLGEGGVSLHLSGDRATRRIRFGPLGVGWASSQTIRFRRAGLEQALVISSLGRVSRR